MNKLPNKDILRPDEVAEYLGVSESTIRREMDKWEETWGVEGIPWFWARGQRRIKRKDVVAYINQKPWSKRALILPFNSETT